MKKVRIYPPCPERQQMKSGGSTAEQNHNIDEVGTKRISDFKSFLANQATNAILKEEYMNAQNQIEQQRAMQHFDFGGQDMSAFGYDPNNSNIDMYINQMQQNAQKDVTDATSFFSALGSTKNDKQLKMKTVLNPMYRDAYKDANKQYAQMGQEIFDDGGDPQYDAQGNRILRFHGLGPKRIAEKMPSEIERDRIKAQQIVQPTYGPINPAVNPFLNTSPEQQAVFNYMMQQKKNTQQQVNIPATGQQIQQQTAARKQQNNMGTKATTSAKNASAAAKAQTALNGVGAPAGAKTTPTIKGNVPVEQTNGTQPNAVVVDPNQVQQPYVDNNGFVVYPKVGGGMFSRTGRVPMFLDPNNISKTEIKTRRAILPGNRTKSITFTHGVPQGYGQQMVPPGMTPSQNTASGNPNSPYFMGPPDPNRQPAIDLGALYAQYAQRANANMPEAIDNSQNELSDEEQGIHSMKAYGGDIYEYGGHYFNHGGECLSCGGAHYADGGSWGKALGYGLLGASVIGAGIGIHRMNKMNKGIQGAIATGPQMMQQGMQQMQQMAPQMQQMFKNPMGGMMGKGQQAPQGPPINEAGQQYYAGQEQPQMAAYGGQAYQGWNKIRDGVANAPIIGKYAKPFHNLAKGIDQMTGGKSEPFTDPIGGFLKQYPLGGDPWQNDQFARTTIKEKRDWGKTAGKMIGPGLDFAAMIGRGITEPNYKQEVENRTSADRLFTPGEEGNKGFNTFNPVGYDPGSDGTPVQFTGMAAYGGTYPDDYAFGGNWLAPVAAGVVGVGAGMLAGRAMQKHKQEQTGYAFGGNWLAPVAAGVAGLGVGMLAGKAMQKRQGQQFEEGGEYDLTDDQIRSIMAAGGQVEFI